MTLADLDDRAWWVFSMPASTTFVPAPTESEARAIMARNSYPGAPVGSYPLTGTRFTSRQALVAELLRKANAT